MLAKQYLMFYRHFLCLDIYSMISSRVEPSGTLIELFFFIPSSYLFVFSGSISVLFVAILLIFKKGNLIN